MLLRGCSPGASELPTSFSHGTLQDMLPLAPGCTGPGCGREEGEGLSHVRSASCLLGCHPCRQGLPASRECRQPPGLLALLRV